MNVTRSGSRAIRSSGLTLIELIGVIVILGLLVAVVLPRFADLREEAHESVVAATASSFESALIMAQVACISEEHEGLDNLPSFGAGNVDFNANCLPSSTNGNNSVTVNGSRCLQVWNGLLSPAPSISTPASDDTDYRAQGSGTTCRYTYRHDSDVLRRILYNAATGEVSVINP